MRSVALETWKRPHATAWLASVIVSNPAWLLCYQGNILAPVERVVQGIGRALERATVQP